ncbi:DUF3631 domain-containing protein [Lutimaribacter marinistellae]|uniref:DUF3631 domain-containing protein n=1 Tax=Lutimaribacter marinistellae TaxID=1820329 RepID=A0ABV7TFF5_9RHOB
MDGQDDWSDIPQVEDVTAADAVAEVQRLATLNAAAYESERKHAAARLGWRASVLDAEVSKARPRDMGDGDNDRPETIEKVEPWPDPVDGASLAEEIRDRLHAHVIFAGSGDADAATLWILGSYLMDTWRLWPRLLITSPTKQCGKSTLLEVIDAMAHRGFIVSNASPAAIFRAIEAWRPTLLLDEADTWMKQNEELAGVLNSGHTRRTARVIRVQEVNGEHLPTAFSTWCPMVIAGIGDQRDTLMSRSIVIGLRRKLPNEAVQRLPFDLHAQLLRIRRQAARWSADHSLTLGAMEIEPPASGDDRMQDNFTALWRIAEVLGDVWPERIAAAYAAQAMAKDDDAEPAGIMMLRDIAEIFASHSTDRIATSEIVGDLITMEERPWADWRHGRPLSAQSVAKLMKPFGIKAKVLKLRGASARVYLRSEVEAAAARYTVQKCNPVTLQQKQEVRAISKRNPAEKVTPARSDNPLIKNEGYGVTPENAETFGCETQDDRFNPDNWK